MAAKTRRLTTEARKLYVGFDALIDPRTGEAHPIDSIVNIGTGSYGAILDVYCTDDYMVTLSGGDRVQIVRTYT